jgi:hypothetical protein
MNAQGATDRRQLLRAGLVAVGVDLLSGPVNADEKKPPESTVLGEPIIVKGLDGMSHVADNGNDPFGHGHNAAAVISSAFFSREQKLDEQTQKEILAHLEARLLTSRIYVARPKEKAEPELIDALVTDLDAGISQLRRSGHNIIFATICLKALRTVPALVTPERVEGLRKMVRSFGANKGAAAPQRDKDSFVDLGDEKKFIRFALEEYLKALELYLNGKGHHGFAGHVLTIGHALLELHRMGHKKTAENGVPAYWQFVQQARDGADLGGNKVGAAPKDAPTPLVKEYWSERAKRKSGEIVSSHLIKYPYSFYALAKEVWEDEETRKRLLEKLYYLTAIS